MPGWKYAAQAVEAEIDEETGILKVRKIASAHDVGTTLNPITVRGQIVGGVVMGLGYAIHERLQDRFSDQVLEVVAGLAFAHRFAEHASDSEAPSQEGVQVDAARGELAVVGIAPALGNAIYDALKVRIRDLPLFPERVLSAIESGASEQPASSSGTRN